jgi:hypothetical protein
MMRIATAAALVLALLPGVAGAVPPPQDTEDYRMMAPHGAWITGQHDRLGRWCCSLGDSALVEVRTVDEHYEVRALRPAPERGVPEGWHPVPDDKVIHDANPVGVPLAWFYNDHVQCFVNGDVY